MSLLMTNACSFGCTYCATRRDRNLVRTAVTPEELASTFHTIVQADLADGLFLTSGIPGRPQVMMDRMLAAAELIRRKYAFRGYVHLKILPGADTAQIERACQLASRVSINLEAPREEDLHAVAPEKSLRGQILPALAQVARQREESGRTLVPAGVTTQLIAGVRENSDRELLQLSTRLVRQRQLTKTHYSAFQPVADTPLENQPAETSTREHRLYQADYLLRGYGFEVDELPFDDKGQLGLAQDPKWLWATRHPEFFPVEILHADREALLRVPGIGPVTANRLLAVRRSVVLRTLEDLRRLGVIAKRARGFLALNGRRFAAPIPWVQSELSFRQTEAPSVPLPCANGISPCAFR
jgi:predicted DNA-binding helix-hairpin-helix protein